MQIPRFEIGDVVVKKKCIDERIDILGVGEKCVIVDIERNPIGMDDIRVATTAGDAWWTSPSLWEIVK